jgi:hypothetical protein
MSSPLARRDDVAKSKPELKPLWDLLRASATATTRSGLPSSSIFLLRIGPRHVRASPSRPGNVRPSASLLVTH